MPLALAGESPQGWMTLRIVSTGSFAIFAGVSASLKRAGVIWFTFLSVDRPERITATSRVKGFLCRSGIGVLG